MIRWPANDYWKQRFPMLCGRKQLAIAALSSLRQPKDNSILFVSTMTPELQDALRGVRGCLLLLRDADRGIGEPLGEFHGVLFSSDPRYQFAEALDGLWDAQSLRDDLVWDRDRGITIGNAVQIDRTAVIEPGVTIASDCVIDANVYIMSGARIGPRVKIGKRCVIRENAVVGGYGFGFALAKGKPTIRIPHVGGVVIGSDVEVGALATICSGTIDPTLLDDNVKVDDHVHIAHNCHIGSGVMITACAEVSGSVSIGPRTWLAPNCSIRDRISIGSDCMVGMGAVVTKPVPDHVTVVGNPARFRQQASERLEHEAEEGTESET